MKVIFSVFSPFRNRQATTTVNNSFYGISTETPHNMSLNAAYDAAQEVYEVVDTSAAYESMEEVALTVQENEGLEPDYCSLQSTHRPAVTTPVTTTHTEHSLEQVLSGEYI